MKSNLIRLFAIVFILASCKVTFITGYDSVLDESLTKMKKDFNLHFIRLARTIQDNDSNNQKIENFRDYYDNMEADLIILKGRAQFLPPKSSIIKNEILNLDTVMTKLMTAHTTGFPDRQGDDRRDIRNAINSAFDAAIKLEEELKSEGEINKK